MKMMYDQIDGISENFVSALDKGSKESSVQDLRVWARRFTNDNIGSVAFGLEAGCELKI
jgi:hypothetical protein